MLTAAKLGLHNRNRLETKVSYFRSAIQNARKFSWSHPLAFGRTYFPELMSLEPAPFHWDIAEGFMEYPRFAVAAPRGSGKTTLITKIGAIWSVFCEDVQEVLIVSASGGLSQTWIEDIGTRCRKNDALHEDFGNFEGVHWSSEHLEFNIGNRRVFIRGIGKGAAVRGRRPNRLIIDDPEDEADLKSELQKRDFEEWFWGALVNTLDTMDKKLTYIGTSVTPDAFVVKLCNNPPPGWIAKSICLYDEFTKQSTWNDKFSSQDLHRIRQEIGEDKFQQEFQNNPVRALHKRLFDLNKIPEVDRDRFPGDRISVCVDPAFAVGGDPWAYTVVEIDEKQGWYVRDAFKEASGFAGLMKTIERLFLQYRDMRVFGIETTGPQKGLEFWIKELMQKLGIYVNVKYVSHPSSKGKKPARIATLAQIVSDGRLRIKPGLTDLKGELRSYIIGKDNQNDHILDSLSMHAEVNEAQMPRERVIMTPEERRHLRFTQMAARVPKRAGNVRGKLRFKVLEDGYC